MRAAEDFCRDTSSPGAARGTQQRARVGFGRPVRSFALLGSKYMDWRGRLPSASRIPFPPLQRVMTLEAAAGNPFSCGGGRWLLPGSAAGAGDHTEAGTLEGAPGDPRCRLFCISIPGRATLIRSHHVGGRNCWPVRIRGNSRRSWLSACNAMATR